MPVMCVKNHKKMKLKNGKRTCISGYDDDYVLIGDNEFTFKQFMEYFVPAYCMTNHKIQGLTVKEQFNIYEWDKMSKREQYTAYSRCTSGENVRIVSFDKKTMEAIFKKWHLCDKPNYVIYQWKCKDDKIKDTYIGHSRDYTERENGHIDCINDENNNLKVYKFIRENGGLDNWYCEKIHSFWACNSYEAKKVEQIYINKYNSTLNSCASCKALAK